MKLSSVLPFSAKMQTLPFIQKQSQNSAANYVAQTQSNVEPTQLNWLSYVNFGKKDEFNEILKTANSPLEKRMFKDYIERSRDKLANWLKIDLDNPDEFTVKITKNMLKPASAENPQGLNLENWFKDYKKEAAISTAGIRGNQNILFPNDPREQINLVGMMLATEAKARAAKGSTEKLAAGEVRYNTDKYIDLISRVQAANGIKTHITDQTIPIWMASFLIFKKDFTGGEYVTSSHSIGTKIATKDLNSQGSQYLPEESAKFIKEMDNILDEIRENGEYEIKISAKNDKHIDKTLMKQMNNGVDLYVDYLKTGVASKENVDLIQKMTKEKPIYIDCVGGCAYKTLSKVLDKLGVGEHYDWFHKEEDRFFHGIGKHLAKDKETGKIKVKDESVDVALVKRTKSGKAIYPVISTIGYENLLENKPVGTVVFITDPDHDRLCVAQLEENTPENLKKLKETGVDFYEFNKKDKNDKKDKVLAVYTPNQSFLMAMDFYKKQLEQSGQWDTHPRFIIKTTASANSWDEWANSNGVKVVNTPVGFKELASIMRKVENQISANPQKDVVIKDVFGKDINLGKNPRLLFAGEESGGMIVGSEEMVESESGRKAIAMREKSATEAIVLTSALVADLEQKGTTLANHLADIFSKNNIKEKFDVREDIAYYDESQPDPEKRAKEKIKGAEQRKKNDQFYLSMAMKRQEAKQSVQKAEQNLQKAKQNLQNTLDSTKNILNGVFNTPEHGYLKFDDLQDIEFVGDGTYLRFPDKYVEIRPSGTDAKTKGYSSGVNKKDCINYARELGNYSGETTKLFNKFISPAYYSTVKEKSDKEFKNWSNKQ